MPWPGHDALDLRVPVDVVSSAATRQEPSVLLKSAPDPSSGGIHACRYLHDRPAESQPARPPCQDAAALVSDRAQAKAMRIRPKPRILHEAHADPAPRIAGLSSAQVEVISFCPLKLRKSIT